MLAGELFAELTAHEIIMRYRRRKGLENCSPMPKSRLGKYISRKRNTRAVRKDAELRAMRKHIRKTQGFRALWKFDRERDQKDAVKYTIATSLGTTYKLMKHGATRRTAMRQGVKMPVRIIRTIRCSRSND